MKMPKEEIEQLKIKIRKGEALANAIKNDSTCREGFEAARKLIEHYKEELERYMTYREIMLLQLKITNLYKKAGHF